MPALFITLTSRHSSALPRAPYRAPTTLFHTQVVTSNTMDNENSVPLAVRFQDAQAIYNQGQLKTKKVVVGVVEMKVSTFMHCTLDQRSAEDYGKTRQLLTAEEVSFLLWKYDILQHAGWLQTLKDVWILALKIAQKRNPDAKVCVCVIVHFLSHYM